MTDREAYELIGKFSPEIIMVLDCFIQEGKSLDEITDICIRTGYDFISGGVGEVEPMATFVAVVVMTARHMYENFHEKV